MSTGEDHSRKSKVPWFEFSNDLSVQQEQLAANPLLQRFADSRTALAADPYRPLYHFVSPESSLNDPNGLCFWHGRWHLFYQGFPPEDKRVHWGHAVSEDLIHWQDLPYAIYPDPEQCCFSGATLVEDSRVIAMYHGTQVGNMIAVSDDPLLLNWKKLSGGAVIPAKSTDGSPLPYSVFDPCIWKKDGIYYSLSGGSLPHKSSGRKTRAEFLFRSPDLINWEYLHPFCEEDLFGLVGDDGACPYFWPIGDRHILLHFSHMSGGKYLIGDYDKERDKFVVSNGGRFNFGSWSPGGVHAPSATPDGRGGVVAIFNINDGKPTTGWDQIMNLPRRLTVSGKDDLLMEPAGDTESLRYDHRQTGSMILQANKEVVLDGIGGNALEIDAEIDPGNSPLIELNVLRSPGKEEYTRIAFYRQRGFQNWERFVGWDKLSDLSKWYDTCDSLITIDSSYSSELPDALSRVETAPVYLSPDEPLKLRVFIDKSVVEVFVNGRQCVALRVYPGREDSTGISLRSQGRDARLVSLDAWQMRSIY